MSAYYPISKERMLKISGVGEIKFEKFGQAFIDEISKYVTENNIEIPQFEPEDKVVKEKVEKSKSVKEETKMITYKLFRSGLTIDEIAKKRMLSSVTIQNHLIECLAEGMDIDLKAYVQTQYELQIMQAIETVGTEKLKPLKEVLPEEVTYFDIRYYVTKSKII